MIGYALKSNRLSSIHLSSSGIEKDKINTKDQEDKTALFRAIASTNTKNAEILLEAGADPNIKCGVFGDTALHQAVRINAGAFVCKLVELGANYL